MTRSSVGASLGFIGIITIIVVILNLPHIQIQTKNLDNLYISYDKKLIIDDIVVWNRGGTVGGNLFFVPNVCLYASVDRNISCIHKGYNQNNPCSTGICENVESGELSSSDRLELTFPKDNLENFTINITAKAYISSLKIASEVKYLNCNLNKTNDLYFCIEENPNT